MTTEHDFHELEKKFAVLEERMNTHEARIDSTLNALRTDIERINTEASKRETRLILTLVGLIVGSVTIMGVGLALVEFLTASP